MIKELTDTATGEIVGGTLSSEDFQRVNQPHKSGETGYPETSEFSRRTSDVAQTVTGIFAAHNDKLFALTALIGFTVAFYGGNIKNWDDFWRYTAFLFVIGIYYGVIKLASLMKKK